MEPVLQKLPLVLGVVVKLRRINGFPWGGALADRRARVFRLITTLAQRMSPSASPKRAHLPCAMAPSAFLSSLFRRFNKGLKNPRERAARSTVVPGICRPR